MSIQSELLYRCHAFEALTLEQLYQILKIRQEVFVVEQEAAYLDCDGHDHQAYHLTGFGSNGKIISYARILPPDSIYEDDASIGRILVKQDHRGHGLGREITVEAMEQCDELFSQPSIKIMAQTYLIAFYKSLGFNPVGEPFLEDGIEHRYMLKE